jgi:hypothetical protein
MKEYLKSWIPKIKNYSLNLDKLSKLYDQPWVLINELNDFIKIIFQSKGKLIVSKNGIVSDGEWELVSIANSILLNINGEKRLYNNQFIDNGLMILKLDGLSNDFFVLANENIIPDLDIESYLNAKYSTSILKDRKQGKREHYQKEFKLLDGRTLQIIENFGYLGETEVKINYKIPENGFYFLAQQEIAYEIQDGKVKMEYYIEEYNQNDGTTIKIGGSRMNGINKNSPVWLDGKLAPDGEYKKGWFSKIQVEKGKIK